MAAKKLPLVVLISGSGSNLQAIIDAAQQDLPVEIKAVISNRKVGTDHPPLVIPEVGINHEGSFEKAIQMIDAAYNAGAECIKFQCHITEAEMIPTDMKPGEISDEKLWDIIKRCELTEDEDTTIYMYYGNTDAISQEECTNTWGKDYWAVHHFEEEDTRKMYDSTMHGAQIASMHIESIEDMVNRCIYINCVLVIKCGRTAQG